WLALFARKQLRKGFCGSFDGIGSGEQQLIALFLTQLGPVLLRIAGARNGLFHIFWGTSRRNADDLAGGWVFYFIARFRNDGIGWGIVGIELRLYLLLIS